MLFAKIFGDMDHWCWYGIPGSLNWLPEIIKDDHTRSPTMILWYVWDPGYFITVSSDVLDLVIQAQSLLQTWTCFCQIFCQNMLLLNLFSSWSFIFFTKQQCLKSSNRCLDISGHFGRSILQLWMIQCNGLLLITCLNHIFKMYSHQPSIVFSVYLITFCMMYMVSHSPGSNKTRIINISFRNKGCLDT